MARHSGGGLGLIAAWVLGLAWEMGSRADDSVGAEEVRIPPLIVRGSAETAGPIESAVTRTLLDRVDLERSEERDLNGVIRGLPGVSLQATVRTALSGLFVRGASAGLGQLSFDGVPLYSSTTGAFNLTGVLVDALQSVDVVRGAAAPRYGSRALGGVVRLTSRDDREGGAFLHLEGGSYGALSETAGGSLAGPRWRATGMANRDDIFDGPSFADPANGNTEGDDFWGHQGAARMTIEPSAGVAFNSSLLYTLARAENDTVGPLPNGLIGAVDDPASDARNETWVAQARSDVDLTRSWASRLQLGYTRNSTSGRDRGRPYGFDQRLLMARFTNTHAIWHDPEAGRVAGVKLSWGGELRQEEGENNFDLPVIMLRDARTTYTGLVELEGQSGSSAGYLGSTLDHYDDFGTHATFYAGMSRALTESWLVRVSGGRGYRVPAFQELYFVPAFGNPDLAPERAVSADLGLEWWPAEGKRIAVTGYYARFEDLIQVELASTAPLLFASMNVARAELWGFEIEAERDWGHGVKTGIDYTYTRSRDLDTGQELLRRPEHQGRVYGEWQVPGVPATLWVETVYHSGYFEDAARKIKADAVARLNAQLSYRLSPRWQIYVRGENLADNRTPEIFSITSRGAAVFGGLRLALL